MKKQIRPLLLAAAMGSFLTAGCVESHHAMVTEPAATTYPAPTGRVIVYEEPPPPRQEVLRSPRDQDSQVWISGYWTYADAKWVWVPGHLETKPTPAAVWVPGHWDHNSDGHGWVWTPGEWE